MIDNVEHLKKERPDLVELFEKMSKEQLINQCYLECIDAINMEERVQLFMNEFTGLSKTNYTLDSLRSIISDSKENIINKFCLDVMEDAETFGESHIISEVKECAKLWEI